MTRVGPPRRAPIRARESPPSAQPSVVRKSSFRTNLRRLWRRMTTVRPAFSAMSGAPPAPGSRTRGLA